MINRKKERLAVMVEERDVLQTELNNLEENYKKRLNIRLGLKNEFIKLGDEISNFKAVKDRTKSELKRAQKCKDDRKECLDKIKAIDSASEKDRYTKEEIKESIEKVCSRISVIEQDIIIYSQMIGG